MRQGLSVRFTFSELNAQRRYHQSTRKWFNAEPARLQSVEYQQFLEHVRLFDQRVQMLKAGQKATPKASVLGNGDVVAAAAQWIDKYPPAHDYGPYGDEKFGFKEVAASFYNVSSAIIHGLKWPLNYVQTVDLELFRMISEGVNVAVAMAECAVALFEAQAQRHGSETGRERFYPDRLEPTVRKWAAFYA